MSKHVFLLYMCALLKSLLIKPPSYKRLEGACSSGFKFVPLADGLARTFQWHSRSIIEGVEKCLRELNSCHFQIWHLLFPNQRRVSVESGRPPTHQALLRGVFCNFFIFFYSEVSSANFASNEKKSFLLTQWLLSDTLIWNPILCIES